MKPHGGQPIEIAGAPLKHSDGAVILVHGRNASAANILDLVPALNRPRLAYLAPNAAQHTWYPNSFMAARESNEPGLTSGLTVLRDMIDNLVAQGIGKDRIVLMGFSQGACLSAEFGVRHPARYGGLVIFSGGLIGPPGTSWDLSGSFDGTPTFLGCSDVDSHVPAARVRESAAVFTRMGAAVTSRLYPGMGHTINDDEIESARAILDSVTS